MKISILVLLLISGFDYDKTFEDLNHEDFYVREKATATLATAPYNEAIPILKKTYEAETNPEVKWRIRDAILHQYWRMTVPITGIYPWLDCLPKHFPNRSEILAKYLDGREYSLHSYYYDVADIVDARFEYLRHLTILFVIDRLENGDSLEEVNKILNEMVRNEAILTNYGKTLRKETNYLPNFLRADIQDD